jgi:hypothetical protein
VGGGGSNEFPRSTAKTVIDGRSRVNGSGSA